MSSAAATTIEYRRTDLRTLFLSALQTATALASDAIGKINVHRNTPADQTVRLPMRLMMLGIDNLTSTTMATKLNTAISGHHRTARSSGRRRFGLNPATSQNGA